MNDDVAKIETRAERKERVLSREHLEQVSMEVAVAKALYAYAKDRQSEIDSLLENGESRKVLNERGAHVSSISKSNPQPRFVIEDMAAVLPAAMDTGAEIIDCLPTDGTEAAQEAVEVLREHAPHLLRPVLPEVEEERLRDDVKAGWEITGEVPAGWAVQEARPGVTSVRVSKVGKAIVDRALGDMKGLLELERGTDE